MLLLSVVVVVWYVPQNEIMLKSINKIVDRNFANKLSELYLKLFRKKKPLNLPFAKLMLQLSADAVQLQTL
jgi:hypothetical protein